MRTLASAAMLLALAALGTADAAKPVRGACWKAPPARTVEEAVIVAQNQANAAARTAPSAATLALSDGRLKAAYGAGLLVGWGETEKRPDFAVVTAVGMSALLAPYAFVGRDGDSAIADVFACEAASLEEMAARAASYLDARMLERIAQRHQAGARLLVALPGSAARPETVWDIGAIAASRHPGATRLIASILRASVDYTTHIDPLTTPVKAGSAVTRNPEFRRAGAGEAFLSMRAPGAPHDATYLIHNGVLFADEGEEYAAARAARGGASREEDLWLRPAYDFFTSAQQWRSQLLIASPRPYMNIQPPQSAFDAAYMRALFLDAYRRGRMSREWRTTFVDSKAR